MAMAPFFIASETRENLSDAKPPTRKQSHANRQEGHQTLDAGPLVVPTRSK